MGKPDGVTAVGHRRDRHHPAARRRAGPDPADLDGGPAHGVDPEDLHRRLGVRDLRRREPAVLSLELHELTDGGQTADDIAHRIVAFVEAAKHTLEFALY